MPIPARQNYPDMEAWADALVQELSREPLPKNVDKESVIGLADDLDKLLPLDGGTMTGEILGLATNGNGLDVDPVGDADADLLTVGVTGTPIFKWDESENAFGSTHNIIASAPLFHALDEKTSGTNGGTLTGGAWRTRDLNTVVTNEIAGASLASNQITLPVGDYFISASAPGFRPDGHKAKLRNMTDASDTIIGTTEGSNNTGGDTTRSLVWGRFTIAVESVFELQHRSITTQATNGFGSANSFGVVEIYADSLIWRVG